MRRWLTLCWLLALLYGMANAQSGRSIQYRADMGFYDEDYMPGAQRLVGHVAFAQDNVRGYCDSAYLYEKDNYIIAFGDRVKILVGDSVRLFGRRAYYDGNAKTAAIAARVRLEKGDSFLLTDSLTYDLQRDVGYYQTGGTIYNNEDTLSSMIGQYYTKTDDAFGFVDVLLYNKKYHIDCDSLQYNASSQIVYFISTTHLKSDSNEIYTDRGWYHTESDISTLHGNVKLFAKEQQLFADSIYYESENEFAQAWHNVTLIDTVKDYIVKGNYFEHRDAEGFSLATDSSLLIVLDDNRDSLFLHADTLKIFFNEEDELQTMLAYNHAKFYRHDLQGACDSLVGNVQDSIITLYFNPVVWANEYQLTGDTIRFSAIDSSLMMLELRKAGFVVGGLFGNTEYNQIKGVNITGFIRDKELYRVEVVNNAECVYYVQEEDSSLIGINTSITNAMRVLLEDQRIKQIRYYENPDGQLHPDKQFSEKDRKLTDFRWLDAYRPKGALDVYVQPIPREKSATMPMNP